VVSVLVDADSYLLELVRYIHLNPLRAKSITSLKEAKHYPYCGHSALLGNVKRTFQDTNYVLRLFGDKLRIARKAYRAFVEKGALQGQRPDLVGGGFIRSAGGWEAVKSMRKTMGIGKSDERILGDGAFVQAVLDQAKEQMEERYRLRSEGYDLETLTHRVSTALEITPEQVWEPGKKPLTVKARSLLCYWAVRKLGYSATALAKKLGVSQPSVSISVRRGEKIAEKEGVELLNNRKL